MIKTVKGDIFAFLAQPEYTGMVHGCNCQHTMGAGIAGIVAKRFPSAFVADLKTPKNHPYKLGTISTGNVFTGGKYKIVINAYTQFLPGSNGDILAIEHAMHTICSLVKVMEEKQNILIPQIGCGIAGLSWEGCTESGKQQQSVREVIESVVASYRYDEHFTFVEYG